MLYRPNHTLVYARTHTHTIQSHDSFSPLGAPSTKHNALSCLNKFKTQMCGNDTAYFNRPFPYVWRLHQWQRFLVCFHLKFDSIHKNTHSQTPTDAQKPSVSLYSFGLTFIFCFCNFTKYTAFKSIQFER